MGGRSKNVCVFTYILILKNKLKYLESSPLNLGSILDHLGSQVALVVKDLPVNAS